MFDYISCVAVKMWPIYVDGTAQMNVDQEPLSSAKIIFDNC